MVVNKDYKYFNGKQISISFYIVRILFRSPQKMQPLVFHIIFHTIFYSFHIIYSIPYICVYFLILLLSIVSSKRLVWDAKF